MFAISAARVMHLRSAPPGSGMSWRGPITLICNYTSNYDVGMEFEWDEAKRQRNPAKHRIDFLDVRQLFEGRALVTLRSPYPDEGRYLTSGIIHGRFVTVVWRRRDGAIRLISARRARDAETRRYQALHGGRA